MWRVPDSVLALRDGPAVVSFVMDQLADPEAFESKVREVHVDCEAEISDTIELKDGRVFERYSRPQRVNGVVVGRVWSFRACRA